MLSIRKILNPSFRSYFHHPVNRITTYIAKEETAKYGVHRNMEKFLQYAIIIGGISGSGYVSSSYYTEVRDSTTYSQCVGSMTMFSIYGFILGSAVGILTPIIVPVASVVSVVRYLYPPTPPPPTFTPLLCIDSVGDKNSS